ELQRFLCHLSRNLKKTLHGANLLNFPILPACRVYRDPPGASQGTSMEVYCMLSGHRSAGRRRGGKSRAARLAVPLAIPMALGLTLGIILAVSGGHIIRIDQSALGASASPSASASAAAPAAPAAPAAAATAANVNCDIIVPANPLSARGLATPYQLTGPAGTTPAASGCTMTNAAALGAFVQATILNPRTGALSVYNPLVITAGTTPAV